MIKPITNSPNFNGVYYSQNNFTYRQKRVTKSIVKNLLMRDSAVSGKMSYLYKYEKSGIDFYMEPFSDEESVDLYACKDDKKKFLGRYNNYDKHFKLKDLESIDKKELVSPEMKLLGMLILAAGVVAIPLITHVRKSINPHYADNNFLKIDSIKNSTDTIASDTIKFMSKIK